MVCGGKLPLYRRVREDDFCSDEHRRSYTEESQQLALRRLHEIHATLPRVQAEPTWGTLEEIPVPAGEPATAITTVRRKAQADGKSPAQGSNPRHPAKGRRTLPPAGRVALLPYTEPEKEPEPQPVSEQQAQETLVVSPKIHERNPGQSVIRKRQFDPPVILPFPDNPGATSLTQQLSERFRTGDVEWNSAQSAALEGGSGLLQLSSRSLFAVPAEPEKEPRIASFVEEVCAVVAAAAPLERPRGTNFETEPPAWSLVFPLLPIGFLTSLEELVETAANAKPEEMVPPFGKLTEIAAYFHAIAPGRFEVQTADFLQALDLAGAPTRLPLAVFTPLLEGADAGILPLPIAFPAHGKVPAVSLKPLQQPIFTPPLHLLPQTHLEIAATGAHARMKSSLGWLPGRWRPETWSGDDHRPWPMAVDFWKNAPRDLKMLAVAIPLLVGLAMHAPLPKLRVSNPVAHLSSNPPTAYSKTVTMGPTTHLASAGAKGIPAAGARGSEQNPPTVDVSHWGGMVSSGWENFRRSLASRAAIELNEDFRSGLDDWEGAGDGVNSWSFDSNGFARPAALALYRPTLRLQDYEMQFLAIINKQALNWVARAKDRRNYYAMRLYVAKPGPLPEIRLSRFAVIDGRPGKASDVPVRVDARADTLYRVGMVVHDDVFAVTVQGSVVDSWTEPRLPQGGVGFQSPRGDLSSLRWVQVSHQADMLGKICAWVAPYELLLQNAPASTTAAAVGPTVGVELNQSKNGLTKHYD